MSTTTQILFVVITAVIFMIRLAVAIYGTRSDGHAANAYRQRDAAKRVARAWPTE